MTRDAPAVSSRSATSLALVAVVRHHCRHALGRGTLESVEQQQQLHDVVVARGRGRLHDEDITAAHVVVDLDLRLAVAELSHFRVTERDIEVLADRGREPAARVACEHEQRVSCYRVLAHLDAVPFHATPTHHDR
jgi:hypothetical protein